MNEAVRDGRWRWAPAAAVLMVLVGVARIAATYPVLNQTFDEPAHLVGGLAWWERGDTHVEVLHTPLPRIAVALGPYLDGTRLTGHADPALEEPDVLIGRGQYWRTLTLARAGTLLFFMLGALAVWTWSAEYGRLAALFGVGFITTLPVILGHAGLATTDMALAATLPLALLAGVRWLRRPTPRASLGLGGALGLALLSKLSAVIFFPAAAAGVLLGAFLFGKRGHFPQVSSWSAVGLVAVTALVLVWGGYRFSTGPIVASSQRPHGALDRWVGVDGAFHDAVYRIVEAPIFPAPDFARGVNALRDKNALGHGSFFLGKTRDASWAWSFFPVAVGVKTPLVFLLLALGGTVFMSGASRRSGDGLQMAPAAAAIALLLAVLPSRIHIGVRHLLPLYPLLAIVSGYGAARLTERGGWGRILLALGAVFYLGSTVPAHPDYLAYFNALGGKHPESILVESDLDWGQDLHRLARTARNEGWPPLPLAYFGTAVPAWFGLNATSIPEGAPITGRVAASRTLLKTDPALAGLDALRPARVIGRSIEVFEIPDPETRSPLKR